MADDAAELIRALGLGKPGMLGHSMGGAVTARAAALRPELLRFVILEDPAIFRQAGWPPPDDIAARGEALDELQAKTKEELIAHCRERFPAWDQVNLAPWAEAKLQVDPRIWELRKGTDATWQETAQAITCPTLLITGDCERGSIIAPDFAQDIVGALAKGRLAHIQGAGHPISRDRFGPYMRAVRAFFTETQGR